MSKQRRSFTAEFKAQLVLELLSGRSTPAQICKQQRIAPQQLNRWKSEFVTGAPKVFEDPEAKHRQERIAELERMVGRLTMQVDILKKVSGHFDVPSVSNGRC